MRELSATVADLRAEAKSAQDSRVEAQRRAEQVTLEYERRLGRKVTRRCLAPPQSPQKAKIAELKAQSSAKGEEEGVILLDDADIPIDVEEKQPEPQGVKGKKKQRSSQEAQFEEKKVGVLEGGLKTRSARRFRKGRS